MKGDYWHVKNEDQRERLITAIRKQSTGEFGFLVKLETGKRTLPQNNAMHKYFSLLANALNDAGFHMVKTLKEGAEIDWTEHSVKKEIWLKVMEPLTGKTSTAKLDRNEVSEVYENVNRFIASRTGVMVPFPSNERG